MAGVMTRTYVEEMNSTARKNIPTSFPVGDSLDKAGPGCLDNIRTMQWPERCSVDRGIRMKIVG